MFRDLCPRYVWCALFLLTTLQTAVNLTESLGQSTTYCVKPESQNGSCPDSCKECQPLGWFVANASHYFKSHTTMFFLEGKHYLTNLTSSKSVLLSVVGVTNFTMEGKETANFDPNGDNPVLNSTIICKNKNGGGLLFLNSSNLSVSRLAFTNCGVNATFTPDNFTVHAAVMFRASYNITLSQILINDSTGYGLHADRVYSYFSIKDSVFMRAKPPNENVFSGNVRFYWDSDTIYHVKTRLTIENSSFKHGLTCRKNRNIPDGSGLTLLIYAPLVRVKIRNINASYNHAHNGANVAFVITDYNENTSTISIKDSFIGYGNATKGAGLMCYIRLHYKYVPESCETVRNKSYEDHIVVYVSNTNFHSNTAQSGGALYIHQHEIGYIDCTLRHISFARCNFSNNTSVGRGAAVAIIKYQVPEIYPHNAPQFSVNFQKCNFSNNSNHYSSSSRSVNKVSVMALLGAERVFIEQSNFTRNNGSAISLTNSNVIFKGNITFRENHALYGGALKICDSSTLYLKPKTSVKFVQNFAKFSGGAIYAEQRCIDIDPPCFYQPLVKTMKLSELGRTIQLEFINNSALIAGQAVYGGSIDFCYTTTLFRGLTRNNSIFKAISNLDQQRGSSQLTSDPYGVCFCNPSTNKSICREENRTIQLYPGARFLVYASAVGQMNGVVPSRIEVRNADSNDNNTSIYPKFKSGSNEHPVVCHEIHISVFSERNVTTLQLMVENVNPAVSGASSASQMTIPEITVYLRKCPWIFEKSKDSCDCSNELLINGIKCDINTVSFHQTTFLHWVGCEWKNSSLNVTDSSDFEGGYPPPSCDKVLYGKNCLDEHCSEVTTSLTFSNLSAQCKEGREKRLCGACKKGYSLTLGIPQCVDNENCSLWNFFLLLFVCLFAGALLVFFLTLFNITVSEGTVNGLLFYANFVHANRTYFFPDIYRTPIADVFRIFIAWLNLDFGFEVCFYAGMDAYQKVWWEFGFLFYLFLLGLLIIYSSHKFIRVTRLVGRNVVSVLSTIMLFSYSKLVRTAVKALAFTYLYTYDFSQPQIAPVWRHDGNIDFFQGKHIPLGILAFFLCTLAFLYTLSLLFIQCLQRRSNWFILKWVNKLRPFFDANTGPCRDHYRFWPGFLLFTRFILFIMYSVGTFRQENRLYFLLGFCIFIFISACISPHGVYKKWPLNILEFSFFLNLGLLSALVVTLSVNSNDVPSIVFTFPSIGIAAITFGCILVFHSYRRISKTRKWRMFVDCLRNESRRQRRGYVQGTNNSCVINSETGEREVDERTPILGQIIHPVENQLREPLLSED